MQSFQILTNPCKSFQILANPRKSIRPRGPCRALAINLSLQTCAKQCKSFQILANPCKSSQILAILPDHRNSLQIHKAARPFPSPCNKPHPFFISITMQIIANPCKSCSADEAQAPPLLRGRGGLEKTLNPTRLKAGWVGGNVSGSWSPPLRPRAGGFSQCALCARANPKP